MNKIEFIRLQIQNEFNVQEWREMEQDLRRKCMMVFALWCKLVREIDIEGEQSSEAVRNLIQDWTRDQKHQSEYRRKYKDETSSVLSCGECVFGIGIDKNRVYCVQYMKRKKLVEDCSDEVGNESSEFFGELFEYLNKLKVYG